MSESSEVMERAELRLGTVLRGKYRLDRVLGVGGMAVVYAATHRNLKRFALKMLHPELSIHEDIRQRFLREGYAANSVRHPGAVAVLDDDVADDGAAFLVMELLEGAPVEELWERCHSRLPLAATLVIAHQLLDVLAAAHANGVVHRDVKPANLFVTFDGAVKVLDFGIARVRDAAATGSKATGTGLLLGTPAFMAPEQALGKTSEIDAQTDVWAVGATLFTLLSGRSVHEAETATQVLIQAATAPAMPLAALLPDLSPAVLSLVDRALAFSKTQRWPSAEAMRDAAVHAQLATFGKRLSTEGLTTLFSGLDRTVLPADSAQWRTPPAARGSALPTVDRATMNNRRQAPAPTAGMTGVPPTVEDAGLGTAAAAPFAGNTTSAPVYADEPIAPAGVPSRRRRVLIASLGGFALLFAAGFAVRALTLSPEPAAGGAAPGASESSAAAPSTSAIGLAPAPAAFAGNGPGPVGGGGSEPPGSSAGIATNRPSSPPGPPAPAAPPSPAPQPQLAPLPTPRSSPPTPAPTARAAPGSVVKSSPPGAVVGPGPASPNPGCNPPYYFDAAGNKVFKKECL
jgi:serine/threonine-protein kinase